ncbi:MAG TPA: hypothetical protein VN937_08770 [Blastocatellia bacterium]|nr:hypothetical protein [Blastocatellia bacterium]
MKSKKPKNEPKRGKKRTRKDSQNSKPGSPTRATASKETAAGERQLTRADRLVAKARGLNIGQVSALQRRRNLTAEALKKVPDDVLKRAVRRLDYPDMARAREAFRLLQQKNEDGDIPSNALQNALKQLDSTRARPSGVQPQVVAGIPTGAQVTPSALMGPVVMPTAGLNPAHTGWTSLGPGNIGGRTRAIAPHPTLQNTMWIGSVGGGVWRTDNAGVAWTPVDDLMANLAVTCLVINPANPNIIYAGTGEGFSNVDALRGAGIFATTNGTNWSQLPATAGVNFRSINRLAISKDGKVLLAATPNGIFRSADPDRLTWTQVSTAPISDVDFHPTSNTNAIAGGLNNGQAFYSTDGGQTWKTATHSTPWSGRVELTYAAKNPLTVYASVQMNNGGEIWRSTDGGKSYSRRNTELKNGAHATYLGDQGWYANTIWAGDPGNSDLVIVGGLDLYRSTDGGNKLVDISTWWDKRSAHADQHAIVAHPGYNGTTNKTVFFGNDGGIYKANDVTTVGNDAHLPRVSGWLELDNTYGVTQFFGGAGNATSGTIIGGAQDNGTLRFRPLDGSEKWSEMFGGDGGCCAADPADQKIFYGEYVYLNIHRSTDGGASSDYISGQFWNGSQWTWKPVPYRITDAMNQKALFIAPFVLDPNNSSRILGGGISLWRTNNAKAPNTNNTGPVWTAIKGSVGARISAIAVAAGNSDVIWVGYDDGQVFKTVNGTQANPLWQKIDHTGSNPLTPARYCTRITIDPKKINVVYACFGGYNRGNVWKTTDGGTKWSNIGNSLPEAPVRSLAVHPRKTNLVYLGTEVGVFASEDGGATWSPTNEGPTNSSVDDLFWLKEILVCATHGRGMFTINLSSV